MNYFKTVLTYKIRVVSILFVFLSNSSFAQNDIFGISQFYQSEQGMKEWNSLHWNNGIARTIQHVDPYDPTDWTEDHSASKSGIYIDGTGIMTMFGSPRFHVNPQRKSKVDSQAFKNIEFTAYYRKKGITGLDYGGMIVGMRGSANGHGSSDGDECDAMCYMARFRNDGKWDFEKELKHPNSSYFSTSGYMKQDQLWKGKKLPENKWIGMKYILENINQNKAVRLRLYIDSISNGNPKNGGVWQMVGEVIDTGVNWPVSDITGCQYTDKFRIITDGGNVFFRTDIDTAQYKMVTIREINSIPTQTPEIQVDNYQTKLVKNGVKIKIITNEVILKVELIDFFGRIIKTTSLFNGFINISALSSGLYFIRIQTGEKIVIRSFIV